MMTVLPLGESAPINQHVDFELESGDRSRSLILAYSEGLESRSNFNRYMQLREEASLEPKVDGSELLDIQAKSRQWIEEANLLNVPSTQEERTLYYSTYDKNAVLAKIEAFTDYLELNYGGRVSDAELEASRAFVDSAFEMYEDAPSADNGVMTDADGSFAFIVPARMSRHDTEYGVEVEPVIPVLRYLPNEMRAQMMIGLPPFVIDTYRQDESKRRGYLVFAPVYGDMAEDIESQSNKMGIARTAVNDAVNFAHRRFGIEVAGLGATLPSLTNYGKTITNKEVITTTGHAGTVELISQTMEKGLKGERPQSVGVLGMGAIGASVAEIIAERYPDIPINIYDAVTGRSEKVAARNGDRLLVAESGATLVEESQVVISAITGRFSLRDNKIKTVEGKLFIDDSQPASLDPEEVASKGGSVQWVIGTDSRGNVATRTGYDFGTVVNASSDIYGCEGEAAAIEKYMNELRERGMGEIVTRRVAERVALNRAVDPQAARYMSAIFRKFGIVASEPQAFGKSLAFKD